MKVFVTLANRDEDKEIAQVIIEWSSGILPNQGQEIESSVLKEDSKLPTGDFKIVQSNGNYNQLVTNDGLVWIVDNISWLRDDELNIIPKLRLLGHQRNAEATFIV